MSHLTHLFVQVVAQYVCFIEEGDITFAPEKKVMR